MAACLHQGRRISLTSVVVSLRLQPSWRRKKSEAPSFTKLDAQLGTLPKAIFDVPLDPSAMTTQPIHHLSLLLAVGDAYPYKDSTGRLIAEESPPSYTNSGCLFTIGPENLA